MEVMSDMSGQDSCLARSKTCRSEKAMSLANVSLISRKEGERAGELAVTDLLLASYELK